MDLKALRRLGFLPAINGSAHDLGVLLSSLRHDTNGLTHVKYVRVSTASYTPSQSKTRPFKPSETFTSVSVIDAIYQPFSLRKPALLLAPSNLQPSTTNT